jgi:hypothetical protein
MEVGEISDWTITDEREATGKHAVIPQLPQQALIKASQHPKIPGHPLTF